MPPTILELEQGANPAGWTHLLTWTLLHSVWVAAFAALLLRALLRLLPAERCSWRYSSSLAALLLVPLLALGSLARDAFAGSTVVEWESADTAAAAWPMLQAGFDALRQSADLMRAKLALWLEPWESWIAAAWMASVAVALGRLAGGWAWLRHECAQAQIRAAPILQAKIARLGGRVGLKQRVPLYFSARCDVPMVVGARRPRIVIPRRLRATLERGELDGVLLHELAHVQRGDPWLRLLEALVQALFVFNPGLHSILARIEREREHCCDARALQVCADRLGYVRALTALECARVSTRVRPVRGRALQWLASHALRATDGALLERVQRMTSSRESWSKSRPISACASLVLGFAGLGVGALPTHTPGTRIVALRTSTVSDLDLAIDAEPARFVGNAALLPRQGERMERVIFVAHPDPARRVVGARATRLRIDASATGERMRGVQLAPAFASDRAIELRLIDAER